MSTTEELRGKAFRITFDTGRMGYRVSIPNYDGGNVVRFEDAEAVSSAAYSQGYKDALTAVADNAECAAPALDDGMYGGIATHALQEFAKAVRSLPIPEAQK